MGEVLFILATAFIVVVLSIFVRGRRYRKNGPMLSPAEVEWLREEAEGRVSTLSPRIMVLAEKERTVTMILDGCHVDGEARLGVEELLAEAAGGQFLGQVPHRFGVGRRGAG